ncbi:hypothetical protein RRG08_018533 [Elysia crispata]|uniref:Uncharacterized protein n=1 Tax=Elysia crispata TaxID=231223 RepID=A0AAE0YDV8_9GAST|nr:hypothetical protein RRG08_018533 [Elysia crispata]
MGEDWRRLTEMEIDGDGRRWMNIVGDVWRWTKIVGDGRRWMNIVGDVWRWTKIVGDGRRWTKIVGDQSALISSKGIGQSKRYEKAIHWTDNVENGMIHKNGNSLVPCPVQLSFLKNAG